MFSKISQTGRRARTLAAAVSVAALMAASAPLPVAAQSLDVPPVTAAQVQSVVETVQPSLVTVHVTRNARRDMAPGRAPTDDFLAPFLDRFSDRGLPPLDLPGTRPAAPAAEISGIGFAVAGEGLIATAHELVAQAERITVTLPDGQTLRADLAGHDGPSGLALLRIDAAQGLPPLAWADRPATLGQTVLTVGRTDRTGPFVSSGFVAGDDGTARLWLDDASASALLGAPILDAEGRVLGIRTGAGDALTGTVPVIAAAEAARVLDDLAQDGAVARGYLGVQIQPVTADLADALGLDRTRGALVAEVRAASPAQKAGLKEGDVVLAVDGEPVATPQALSAAIAARTPGQSVSLDLWRMGEPQAVTVSLGALPGQPVDPDALGVPAERVPDLGLALAPLDDTARTTWGIADSVDGVLVTSVENPALEDLRQGDVIVSVQRLKVESPADVREGLQKARSDGRTTALLLVDRQGMRTFVTVPLAHS